MGEADKPDEGIMPHAQQQYGIYLAVEFEPGFVIDNSDLLLRAFDQIGSPILRMNADIGHMFLQDPESSGLP